MDIRVKWFTEGKYPQFNVQLASNDKAEEFLTIKGCRIVNGAKGDFVSWPSTKSGDKYWSHVWANEKFAATVLEKALEAQPKTASEHRAGKRRQMDEDSDLPF
jgi:DNA-binding cell septation regulator SpoVG